MLKSIFSMAVVRVITLGFPLLIIPLLIKILGLENYGRYAVIFAISNVVAAFINYGFDYTASRDFARTEKQHEQNQLFSIFLICKSIVAVIIFFIIIFISTIKNYALWDVSATLLYSISQVIIPIYVFQGLKKMGYLIFNTLFLNISYLIFLLFILYKGYDLTSGALFFSYALINLIAAIAMVIYIRSVFSIKIKPVHLNTVKEKFSEGFAIFISRIFSMGISQVGIIALSHTLNPTALGYYAVGDKLIRATNSIFYAFQQATFPYFCKDRQIKKFNQLMVLLVIGAVSGVLVINLFSDFIAFSLLHLNKSGYIFSIISWALIPMAISGMIGINYLLANNMNKIFSGTLLFGAIVNLALLYSLSRVYSWHGAVYATLITETLIALIMVAIYFHNEYVKSGSS